MAEATLQGSVTRQRYANNATWYSFSTAAIPNVGRTASRYYPACVEFRTPDFKGKAKKVALSFSIKRPSAVSTTNHAFRYALCTSDGNASKYANTANAVSDAYQLATSTWSVSSVETTAKSYTLTITANVASLKPNTLYYLFIWAYNVQSYVAFSAVTAHTVSVTYEKSAGALIGGQEATFILKVGGSLIEATPLVFHDGAWRELS